MAFSDLIEQAKAQWEQPRVWQKLALIAATMLVPVGLLAFTTYVAHDRQGFAARQTLEGTSYLQPMARLTRDVLRHRDLADAVLQNTASRHDLRALQDVIDRQIEQIKDRSEALALPPGTSQRLKAIAASWHDLQAEWPRLSAEDSRKRHDQLLGDLIADFVAVGEQTGVLFDPILGGYYQLPMESELLGRIQGLATSAARQGEPTAQERQTLLNLLGSWRVYRDWIHRGTQAFALAEPSETERLREFLSQHEQAAGDFIQTVEAFVTNVNPNAAWKPDEIEAAGRRAVSSGFRVFETAEPMLFGILKSRVDQANRTIYFGMAALAIGLMLTLLIVQRITRSLINQIDAIMNLFAELGIGNYDARVEVLNRDELGSMAVSLNAMLDNTLTLIQSQEERDAIQASIAKLLDEVSGVAAGDLTREAEVTADFTGSIADAFNHMIEQLRKIIGNVQRTTRLVQGSADEIHQAADRLVKGSETQATQIVTTSVAIEEMATSIRHVSENADDSAQVARQALANASQGNAAVQDTIQGMHRIRDQVQETARRMKRLGESTQEIGQIIELIDDIADRTSILALNASIQAAAAGEAGRGFAVVAEEVERLAVRSTDATKKISTLVNMIQIETNEAVSAMERSIREVVDGSKLADQAGHALGEIETVSHRLAALIQSISETSRSQAQRSDTVARAMIEISRITRETSEGTKKNADAVHDLALLAEQLRATVSPFRLPKQLEDHREPGPRPLPRLPRNGKGKSESTPPREPVSGITSRA